ncbi:hypothetical protein [Salinisphaera sp. LB1]|uniref:hypothetical protein n=1 Tax=Salinisphaera sp. LB1 TaxID=2183911 RepID=UPI000D7076C0|nr:hypothetical protein [Salinisphaera sp. LB1]AWN14260.1 hypothetical protein SALB1_0053 [Salinisphaera sp. LB1]
MRDTNPIGATAPHLADHPKSLNERLQDHIEYGPRVLILVAGAALFVTCSDLTAGAGTVALFIALGHTFTESPYLSQLPFIALDLALHPHHQRREIEAWARAGWYRERFEPKGHDLQQLRCIPEHTIADHRKRRR